MIVNNNRLNIVITKGYNIISRPESKIYWTINQWTSINSVSAVVHEKTGVEEALKILFPYGRKSAWRRTRRQEPIRNAFRPETPGHFSFFRHTEYNSG